MTGRAKAYSPQVDRVEMAGEYNAPAPDARAFLFDRLKELGERPYISGGTLKCKLHSEDGSEVMNITQRGRSVWISGSLAKWGGKKEGGRYVLPDEEVYQLVCSILERLGLDDKWVKIHSIEYGIDILVDGDIYDYAPYLRMAKGHKPITKAEVKAKGGHYQGNVRGEFKVYNKGAEAGIQTPRGKSLLRWEYERKKGASEIGKALGLGTPLHAEDLAKKSLFKRLWSMVKRVIEEALPDGIPTTQGKPKGVGLSVVIQMLRTKYGVEWHSELRRMIAEQAEATFKNGDPRNDKTKRKRARDFGEGLIKLDTNEHADRFNAIREALNEHD